MHPAVELATISEPQIESATDGNVPGGSAKWDGMKINVSDSQCKRELAAMIEQ
jgi:hypothetical protein